MSSRIAHRESIRIILPTQLTSSLMTFLMTSLIIWHMHRTVWLALCLIAATSFGVGAQEPVADELPPLTTKSPSGLKEPIVPDQGSSKYRIEKGLSMFQAIRDDAIFPWTDTGPRNLADAPADEMEERAYDEVLRHARQFSAAELEAHARRDVTAKDLYTNGRLSYKLELIYFEGWLRRLRRAEPTEILKASGVTNVYEAWIFPDGNIDPICVFVTELPPGLEPQSSVRDPMNRWVSVAGYYFKTLRYEANQVSRDELGKHTTRRAPVLMGRSITLQDEPEGTGTAWRQSFLPLVVGGVATMAVAIIGLSWYFKRGDAALKRELDRNLTTNPFENA